MAALEVPVGELIVGVVGVLLYVVAVTKGTLLADPTRTDDHTCWLKKTP